MSRPVDLVFAANNGDLGGGEVMLLAMAHTAAAHGYAVHVVGPSASGGVLDQARASGLATTHLSADRRQYLRELRLWTRGRSSLLWCNGLVPAVATTGQSERIVHLHRLPRGPQLVAANAARRRATATVVPSRFLSDQVPGSVVLANWTAAPPPTAPRAVTSPFVVGFLGRWADEKGVDLLIRATDRAATRGHALTLVLGGEPRFDAPAARRAIDAALAAASIPVRRLGWTAPDDLYSQVDAVVVPSRAPEAFGLVAAEAMARALPLVVTDTGALPEIVGPRHPWIAHADDVDSLTARIEDLLNASEQQRAAVAASGQQRWLDHFAPAAGQARFLRFLDGVLSGPAVRS